MFPVRCYTCGKVIAHLWKKYEQLVEAGMTPREACKELNIQRYCCKTIFLTHCDDTDERLEYSAYETAMTKRYINEP